MIEQAEADIRLLLTGDLINIHMYGDDSPLTATRMRKELATFKRTFVPKK